jgi:hypothetical protein
MPTKDAVRSAKSWDLRHDFTYYARHCLKVRSKSGAIVLFELNTVQRRVNEAAERQMASAGRIRILALKARQPGISTYVEGRFYWKTTRRKGVRAFILTHRDQATNNLFAIAKRFHDNCPPAVKPQIKVSNAKELDFLRLVSGYRVGTAKAEGVGRADTIQKILGVDEEQALELSIMFIRKLLYHAAVVIVEEGDPSEPSG